MIHYLYVFYSLFDTMVKTLRSCEALLCQNTNRNSTLTLFSFPNNNFIRLKMWKENIKMKDSSRKEKFLCSDHFEDCTFTNTLKQRLLPGAIPTFQMKGEISKCLKHPCIEGISSLQHTNDECNYTDNTDINTNLNLSEVITIKESFKENSNNTAGIYLPTHIPSNSDSPCPSPIFNNHSKVICSSPNRSSSEMLSEMYTPFKLTPKTRKINQYKTSLYRLKRKIFFQNKRNNYSKQILLKELKAHVSPRLFNIIAAQIKNSSVSPLGRRWKPGEKSFAFNIYLASPRAYKILRKLLCLPSVRTLSRSIQGMCDNPGFSEQIFNALKLKIIKQTELQKQCILMVDELAIRPKLQYLSAYDHVIGYQDIISLRNDGIVNVATHALVFMIRGVTMKWKQILGYFLVYHSMPGSSLKTLVVNCIRKLQDVGLKVIALICDQGSNNQKMSADLQISIGKTFFNVNDKRIYFFYDPPHLIKSLRNNMLNYNVHYSDKVAKWKYIQEYFNIDDKLPMKNVPKLTKYHISPAGRNKMKVKYATQALSNSVAAAICLLTSLNVLPGEASQTADFIFKIDKLFDSFNSVSFLAKKELLCAVTKNSSHIAFWKEMSTFVNSWKFYDNNNKLISTHCKKGWLISIHSAIDMCTELLQQNEFVLMRRFNQDPLENSFSVIRSKRGNDSNPDCVQLVSCLKAIMINNFFSASDGTNCESDFDQVLLSLQDKQVFSPVSSSNSLFVNQKNHIESFMEEIPITVIHELNMNILFYITGYIANKLLIMLNQCQDCKEKLLDMSDNRMIDTKSLLTYFKDYTGTSLKYPSKELFKYVRSMSEIDVDDLFTKDSVLGNLKKIFSENCIDDWILYLHDEHQKQVREYVILLYSKITLCSKIRKINRELKV